MFGKLVLVILVLGGVAAATLVDRQQRLDTAAEMQRTHARLRQHEQALWRLRADIAYRTRPHEIRAAIERLNVRMVPIPDRLLQPRLTPPQGESLAAGAKAPRRAPQPGEGQTVPAGDHREYGG